MCGCRKRSGKKPFAQWCNKIAASCMGQGGWWSTIPLWAYVPLEKWQQSLRGRVGRGSKQTLLGWIWESHLLNNNPERIVFSQSVVRESRSIQALVGLEILQRQEYTRYFDTSTVTFCQNLKGPENGGPENETRPNFWSKIFGTFFLFLFNPNPHVSTL